MTDVITAITTALGTIQGNFMSAFGDIVPIALTIMGAVLVVRLAIKAFKSLTGK